jgi:small subunit ribosomal protein S1
MSQEANQVIDENNNENFAEMLDSYTEKEYEVGQIIEGKIVEIREDEDKVLISIGGKREPYISLSEIKDSEGKITFEKDDDLNLVITSVRDNSINVSHKQYLDRESVKKFIEEEGVENIEGKIINGSIVNTTKRGYYLEDNGIKYFMPSGHAFLQRKQGNDTRKLQDDKKVRAKVIKVDVEKSTIIVSRKQHIRDEIKKRQEFIDEVMKEEAVQCKVIAVTKDKLVVDVDGQMKGLIASEEISHRTGKINPFRLYTKGDVVTAKALSYDQKERVLNLSIKEATIDPWLEIQENLEPGDVIEVTVSNIEHYGAFVDIGNDAEGFLHVSEVTWDKKISHPQDYITVGDVIEVEVVEIDPVAHRLRVSRKKLLPKPFELFKKERRVGDRVKGTVTNLTEFGAFIKIDQVEGLLRNSDYDWTQTAKCKDLLNVGDEVEVEISDVDTIKEKIALSRKALLPTPIQEFSKTHSVGDIVKGKIRDVKEFGAFITIGENVDALIRTEDMLPKNKEEFVKGFEVEGMIIALDPRRDKLRLSIRRLERAKEQKLLAEINAENDQGNNAFADLLKAQLK